MQLHSFVERSGDLAPLPPTAVRLAEVLSHPDSSIQDVVQIIKYDQAVTAQVLRCANAASGGSSREIHEVKDAVIRLGGARILARLVGKHIRGGCSGALPAYGYSEQELWRHSVASAAATEVLSGSISVHVPAGAFTAALLHDIGKLLLARQAPAAEIRKVWTTVGENQCTCEDAERIVFGFSHADIGARVGTEWGLPPDVVEAIEGHHRASAPGSVTTDCVALANTVARSIGVGLGFEGMRFMIDEELGGRLGLTRERFERICAHTIEKYASVLGQYELRSNSEQEYM